MPAWEGKIVGAEEEWKVSIIVRTPTTRLDFESPRDFEWRKKKSEWRCAHSLLKGFAKA